MSDTDVHDARDGSTDEPVACTITEETRAEREAFIATNLAPYVETVERHDAGGWRLRVRHDEAAVEGLTTFVRREHRCCAFATLEVTLTPGDDHNELAVYGPDGTVELFRPFVDRLVEEYDAELSA